MMNSSLRNSDSKYQNPFSASLAQDSSDINHHIYPKLQVEDGLSRIIQGKEETKIDDLQADHFGNINHQIAGRILDKDQNNLRMLQLKPEKDTDQKYTSHSVQSKIFP